jgi:hypothetical protein
MGIFGVSSSGTRNKFSDGFDGTFDEATDGSLWKSLRGTWSVVLGKASSSSAANTYPIASIDMPENQGVTTISMKSMGQGSGAALWITDSGNWWAVSVGTDAGVNCNCQTCCATSFCATGNCNAGNCNAGNCNAGNCTGGNCATGNVASYSCTGWNCASYTCTGFTGGNCSAYGNWCSGGVVGNRFCRSGNNCAAFNKTGNCKTWNSCSAYNAGNCNNYTRVCNATNAVNCANGNCNPGSCRSGNIASYTCTSFSCTSFSCTSFSCTSFSCTSFSCTSFTCTSFTNCNCQTCYPPYIRLIKSVSNTVTEVTKITLSTVVNSLRLSVSGSQVTAKAYSDTDLASQIGSDLVFTPTGVALTTSYGIIITPSATNQGDSLDDFTIETE